MPNLDFKRYKSTPNSLYTELEAENISLNEKILRESKNELNLNKFVESMGISLTGKHQVLVSELYEKATYLVPALVEEEIRKGMEAADRYNYKDLVATTIPVNGNSTKPFYIPEQNTDSADTKEKYSLSVKTSGSKVPKIEVLTREKDITLQDYGLGVDASYKVLHNMPWQTFAVILKLIGASLSAQKLADIYTLGTTGDGTVGASENVFNGTDDVLSFGDLVCASSSFGAPFSMNTILADTNSFATILDLSRFNNVVADQNTTRIVTPFGANIKQVNSTPGTTITNKECVLIDKNFAVIEHVNMGLMVEASKIIDRKIEEAVVTDDTVFSIFADGAIKQLEWHS